MAFYTPPLRSSPLERGFLMGGVEIFIKIIYSIFRINFEKNEFKKGRRAMIVSRHQRKALVRKIRRIAFQKGIKGAYSLEVRKDGVVVPKENATPLSFSDVNSLFNIWKDIMKEINRTFTACGFNGRLTLRV